MKVEERGGGEAAEDHDGHRWLLPGLLAEFRARRPDVRPQLEIINSHSVLKAVRLGRSQVGFVEGLDWLEKCEAITVARDRLLLVVSAEHRWAWRSAVPAPPAPLRALPDP